MMARDVDLLITFLYLGTDVMTERLHHYCTYSTVVQFEFEEPAISFPNVILLQGRRSKPA